MGFFTLTHISLEASIAVDRGSEREGERERGREGERERGGGGEWSRAGTEEQKSEEGGDERGRRRMGRDRSTQWK